jgi:uncharacterized protein (TIGR02145 family)
VNGKELGFLLPRVSLGDVTAWQLKGSSDMGIGMMVYNTNSGTIGGIGKAGVYIWTGEGGWEPLRWNCSEAPAQPGRITFSSMSVVLGETFTASIAAVPRATSYTWALTGGLTASPLTTTSPSISITGASAGTYQPGSITVKANNDCGSSADQSSADIVTVNREPCSISVTDIEGNEYCAAMFGEAGCWMTQNLRSTKNDLYTDLTANSDAGSDASLKYYWYPNNSTDILNDHPEYGLLYTWAAASGRTSEASDESNQDHTQHQGICPSGWHLPSDYEWNQLEKEISNSTTGTYGTTPTTVWDAAWAVEEWTVRGSHGQVMQLPGTATDCPAYGSSLPHSEGGFAAIIDSGPGGDGIFGGNAYFCTSSFGAYGGAITRWIICGSSFVWRPTFDRTTMTSVRCKRD